MMFNRVGKTLFLASSLAAACGAQADNAEDSNKNNNQLNVAPRANLQDYYPPDSTTATRTPMTGAPCRSRRTISSVCRNWCAQRCRSAPAPTHTTPQFVVYTGINVTFGK
jgi:hypothetical protein